MPGCLLAAAALCLYLAALVQDPVSILVGTGLVLLSWSAFLWLRQLAQNVADSRSRSRPSATGAAGPSASCESCPSPAPSSHNGPSLHEAR